MRAVSRRTRDDMQRWERQHPLTHVREYPTHLDPPGPYEGRVKLLQTMWRRVWEEEWFTRVTEINIVARKTRVVGRRSMPDSIRIKVTRIDINPNKGIDFEKLRGEIAIISGDFPRLQLLQINVNATKAEVREFSSERAEIRLYCLDGIVILRPLKPGEVRFVNVSTVEGTPSPPGPYSGKLHLVLGHLPVTWEEEWFREVDRIVIRKIDKSRGPYLPRFVRDKVVHLMLSTEPAYSLDELRETRTFWENSFPNNRHITIRLNATKEEAAGVLRGRARLTLDLPGSATVSIPPLLCPECRT